MKDFLYLSSWQCNCISLLELFCCQSGKCCRGWSGLSVIQDNSCLSVKKKCAVCIQPYSLCWSSSSARWKFGCPGTFTLHQHCVSGKDVGRVALLFLLKSIPISIHTQKHWIHLATAESSEYFCRWRDLELSKVNKVHRNVVHWHLL